MVRVFHLKKKLAIFCLPASVCWFCIIIIIFVFFGEYHLLFECVRIIYLATEASSIEIVLLHFKLFAMCVIVFEC